MIPIEVTSSEGKELDTPSDLSVDPTVNVAESIDIRAVA